MACVGVMVAGVGVLNGRCGVVVMAVVVLVLVVVVVVFMVAGLVCVEDVPGSCLCVVSGVSVGCASASWAAVMRCSS